ncbi:hypothetical protein BDQ12DRAFT_439153 [Crucibulum laeve]|uniref:Transmembrane protein n=1 Tax=Crucibulum laeve TaxID=68775 RepID=A0A5C3M7Q2_9AGAR|nr:hypothetical protein BDQ12DRAFT_439153 [Crucibulum laeve]
MNSSCAKTDTTTRTVFFLHNSLLHSPSLFTFDRLRSIILSSLHHSSLPPLLAFSFFLMLSSFIVGILFLPFS